VLHQFEDDESEQEEEEEDQPNEDKEPAAEQEDVEINSAPEDPQPQGNQAQASPPEEKDEVESMDEDSEHDESDPSIVKISLMDSLSDKIEEINRQVSKRLAFAAEVASDATKFGQAERALEEALQMKKILFRMHSLAKIYTKDPSAYAKAPSISEDEMKTYLRPLNENTTSKKTTSPTLPAKAATPAKKSQKQAKRKEMSRVVGGDPLLVELKEKETDEQNSDSEAQEPVPKKQKELPMLKSVETLKEGQITNVESLTKHLEFLTSVLDANNRLNLDEYKRHFYLSVAKYPALVAHMKTLSDCVTIEAFKDGMHRCLGGESGFRAQAAQSYRECRRASNETILDYSQRFERCALNVQADLDSRAVLDVFISGLQPKALIKKMRERIDEPQKMLTTFTEVVQSAGYFDACMERDEERHKQSNRSNQAGQQNLNRDRCTVHPRATDHTNATCFTQQKKKAFNKDDSGKRENESKGPPYPRPKDYQGKWCTHCAKKSHDIAECFVKDKTKKAEYMKKLAEAQLQAQRWYIV
jgi:hypothetical protein